MKKERLDKIISSQLNISRNDAKTDIRKGAVCVNGSVFRDPSVSVSPETDLITHKGQAVVYKPFLYIVMNKPKGVLSASNDKNRQTVIDLVPKELRRPDLAPVGRLDKDTTGLLLITDDGQFAHKVISPKSDIKKLYEVELDRDIPKSATEDFKRGIVLADGTKCMPAELKILDSNKALVEIREGKYHQIKRMFGVIGLGVAELKRIRIGNLHIPADIPVGQCRELTDGELALVLL